MNILIDIGHPAHVHMFKNFAWIMEAKGHKILFTTSQKEFEQELLTYYGFKHLSFGKRYKTLFGKMLGLVIFNIKLLKISLKFKPDIYLSHGSMYAAQIAWLLRKPHIAFEDTGNMEQIFLYLPFTKIVFTPNNLPEKLGRKQFLYNGFHELLYLHPEFFQKKKSSIKSELGLSKNEKFALLRFISWEATHDKGQHGLSEKTKKEIIAYLSKRMRLFISSEAELPPEYESYKIKIQPQSMHDILKEAEIVVSEGATMASEAGILGTPSIYINTLVRCYNEEQEKYGTVHNFQQDKGVLSKIEEILKDNDYKITYSKRAQKLISDKINVTRMLVWFIDNYPESYEELKNDPNVINGF